MFKQSKFFLIIFVLGVFPLLLWQTRTVSADAVQPELPRIYLDTTFPHNTGRTLNVNAGEDLQAVLDQVQCGDTIILQAGATFNNSGLGGYRLKKVGDCSGNWIVIKSSKMDLLPPQGTRVKPSDAVNMPKIVSPNNEPAIQTISDANYYWLAGLEITTTYMAPSIIFSLVYFGTYGEQLAHHIVVDRSYIHGNSGQYVNSGVGMAGSYMAVVDSYISRIHDMPFESQAVYVCKGPGPYKVVNNYLEATGENFFSGDCGSIPGVLESDIELRNNYIYKPTSWYTESPDYEGTAWFVKNSIEFKNGQRALIEGNVIEHNYPQGQVGWAVVLSPRKNGTPYVNDITFRKNIVKNVPNGISILGRDDGDPNNPILIGTTQANRILVQDNIFDGVDGTRWGGPGGSWGALLQVSGSDLAFDHNTGFQTPVATGEIGWVYATYEGVKAERFTFTNNLYNYNRGGLVVDGVGSGFPALNSALADNYHIEKNVLVATVNKVSQPWCWFCDSEYYASLYPPNNYFPLTADEVGMTNYNNGLDGNYTLLPSSPYKNAGTDGKDIGADIAAVLYATRGAVSGNWDRAVGLSPASQSFAASGGSGVVYVTFFTGGSWSAESSVDWIAITSGATGSGNGQVGYSVSANGRAFPRAGILTIGGETFPVNQEAGSDTTAPSISISAPAGGATVSGFAVTVSAAASDDVAVVGVQFKLDGANLGAEVTAAPYSISWNTTTAANGTHTLTAVARDGAGNTATSSAVSVTVSNNSGGGGSGGGGCFIATAAYGSALEPQVVLLQMFRDRYLLRTPAGRAFVRWYYRISPPVAVEIQKSPALRLLVRGVLWPVVGVVWLSFYPWIGFGLLLAGGGWLRLRKKSG